MNRTEAALLFILFATQLFITYEPARVLYGAGYLILCVILLVAHRRSIPPLVADAIAVGKGQLEDGEPPPGTARPGSHAQ